jgi:hypothetical protein
LTLPESLIIQPKASEAKNQKDLYPRKKRSLFPRKILYKNRTNKNMMNETDIKITVL